MLFGLASRMLPAIELGVIGGRIGDPSEFYYGLSGGAGLLVPMLKLEVELIRVPDSGHTDLSVGVKIRPRLGSFGPFAVVGGGAQMDRLNLDFGEYDWFTFIGAGVHFYLKGFLSIRGDFRYMRFSSRNFFRYGLGAFFHI